MLVFCKQQRCWRVVILAKHRPEKGVMYLQNNSVNVFVALLSKGCLNKDKQKCIPIYLQFSRGFNLEKTVFIYLFYLFLFSSVQDKILCAFTAAGSYVFDFKLTTSMQCGLFGA